ncbi:MAG: NADH-quinone oxidoreductase subunit N [Chthonomonadetes bacterium]|nr:NADH-quinone oxidoreductase subunit N [Chthonomonadetes bacterium]
MNGYPPLPKDILFTAIAPEMILTLVAMVVLLAGLTMRRGPYTLLVVLSLAGIIASAVSVFVFWERTAAAFAGTVISDQFAQMVRLILLGIAGIAVLMAEPYMQEKRIYFPEYFALVLFSTAGGMVMASAQNLMVLFIGLEILSLSMYVMAGLARTEARSEEAALKYFLLGAFASGFLLYGIALIYGASGSTNLNELMPALFSPSPEKRLLLYGGLALVLVGLGFKAALVPFHVWTPDVYEGAPTAAAAFMASAAKTAAFAVFIRVAIAFQPANALWVPVLAVLAVLTMTVGNLLALAQSNLKRMLAYSSIAHAGYLLVGVVAISNFASARAGISAVLYYFIAYALMTMGAFAVASLMVREGTENNLIDELSGLGTRSPHAAAMMTVFMLSLAGIPTTAGFLGKFFLFNAALQQGSLGLLLAIVLAVNSVVSAFYYLRLIVVMYFRPAELPVLPRPRWGVQVAIALCMVGSILFGLYPLGLDQAQQAANNMMRVVQTVRR